MNYTVIWLPRALAELADAWSGAIDRNAVSAASERIDRLLESDPLAVGESRSGANRIVFEPPLAAIFRVDRAARMVFVRAVGEYGRPGK